MKIGGYGRCCFANYQVRVKMVRHIGLIRLIGHIGLIEGVEN